MDETTHVLLADRFWHTGQWEALAQLLQSRARITVVVYDLLSLRQPKWFAPGVGERFRRYLQQVLPRAQQVVCLSQVVARDLQDWVGEQGLQAPLATVVTPGHRIWQGAPVAPPALPKDWRDGSRPFVLQVGTIEPRKNHALTLAALRMLWDQGSKLGALFLGQRGWLMDPFMEELSRLPQWQRQLLWLSECTDAQLDWCYRHAAAVFYPSANEGYGLPLAEAAGTGTPVIASDTAVHREVVRRLGKGAPVQLCQPLAQDMAQALQQALAGRHGAPGGGAVREWNVATASLLEAIGLSTAPAQRPPQTV
ncbi:glycosyltransferase family 1 protein [uncultured Ramlibacter sp.]|uniref:glycosyltransferase family 4 protein n=1 Tax=uncultured Ramlibacter sp. TaxID=260755 RepID=UPI002620BE42|nr:glycosyltransferase family 1 protein [uncultured Ramlibacter sp.]